MSSNKCVPIVAFSLLLLGFGTMAAKASPVDPQSIDLYYGEPTITIPEGGLLDFYDNTTDFTDIDISGVGDFSSGSAPGPSPDNLAVHSFFDVFVEITIPPGTYQYSTPLYPEQTGTLNVTPVPAALPLFATGLGALGLFGWRRRRKIEAATAAA